MDFFISNAWAQASGGGASMIGQFSLLILIFGVFYFMLLRPQMKRAKQHRQMVSELSVGDEVVSNGGLLGKVRHVGETFLDLELADAVTVKLQKYAISAVLPKGTIKGLVKDSKSADKPKALKADSDGQ